MENDQGLPKFDIDVLGALKSGYNEIEIAEQVAELANAELSKTGKSFDYKAAKAAGITDSDIIQKFGKNIIQGGASDVKQRRFFEGISEGGGGLGGMIRGGQLGVMATAAIPIPGARIAGGLIGGLGGLILGSWLGGKASDVGYAGEEKGLEGVGEALTGEYQRPQATPEYRPAGEAAYTIGASIPYAATPWLLPKQGVNLGAAKYLENITRMQKNITGSLGLTRNAANNATFIGRQVEKAKTLGRAGVAVPAMAAKTPGYIGRGVEYLGTAAQRASATPQATALIESGGILGSATGAYTAERLAPGDIRWRLLGELTGGFAGTLPSIRMIGKLGAGGEGIIGRFSSEAREQSVADRLYQIVESAKEKTPAKLKGVLDEGEEVKEGVVTDRIVQLLLEDDGIQVTRTAAQKAGVPILNDIEVNLLRANLANGLGVSSRASSERTLDAIRGVLNALSKSSDPKALQDYARLRDQYFKDILSARLSQESFLAADKAGALLADDQAEALVSLAARGKAALEATEQAAPAVERIRAGLDKNRDELGEMTKEAVYRVLGEARKQENELWSKIDDTIEIDARELVDAFDTLKAGLSTAKQKKLPSEMTTFVDEVTEGASLAAKKDAEEQIKDLGQFAREAGENAINNAGGIDQAINQLTKMVDNPMYSNMEQKNFRAALDYVNAKKVMDGGETTNTATVTLGQLRRFRSDMLDLASGYKAGADPDRQLGRVAGKLAERTLKVLEKEGDDGVLRGVKEYDDARSFSRALNDVFSEGFVGARVLAKKTTGEDVVPPEIFVDEVLSGTQSKVGLRLRQLEDAVNFMGSRTAQELGATPEAQKISQEAFTSLREVEDGILRLAAAEGVLDADGNVIPKALDRFLNNPKTGKARIMEDMKLNTLLTDLQDANKAQVLFKQWQDENSLFNQALESSVTFRNFIGEEDAGSVITKALGDPMRRPSTPAKNFKALVRFVTNKDAPEQAGRALYDAVLDRAYMYGGGEGVDQFSFRRMHEYLFSPVARGEDSPMVMLRKAGIVDDNEIERLAGMFDIAGAARKTQSAVAKDVPEMELMNMDNQLEEGFVRIVSAGAGPNLLKLLGKIPGVGRMFEATTGGSLVAANVTSQAMVNFFENMPKTMTRDIWKKVAEDPAFAAEMLKLGRTRAQQGLGKRKSFSEEFKERKPSAFDATARTYIQQALPAATERKLSEMIEEEQPRPAPAPAPAQAPVQPPMAPAPAPTAQGPAQPTARAQMSQLFPNDPILGSRSGIGSLMG